MKKYIKYYKLPVILSTVAVLVLSLVFSTQVLGLSYEPFSWKTYSSAYGYQLFDFTAHINETYVYGDTDGSNVPVNLRLIRDESAISEVDVETDTGGYFNAYFTAQILEGDEIEVNLPDTSTIVIPITALTVQIDKANDVVSGEVESNRSVDVYVWSWPIGSDSLYVNADSSGAFTANFTGQLDIIMGAEVDVSYYNSQGYRMKVRDVLAEGIGINMGYDYAWGYAKPGATVDLTLKDDNGDVKATATDVADARGWFATDFANPTPVDIAVGDTVEMQYSGAPVQAVTAVDVMITDIDPDTDVITGVAPANSKIELYVYDDYAGERVGFFVQSDGSGTFTADLSSAQLTGMHASTVQSAGEDLPSDTMDPIKNPQITTGQRHPGIDDGFSNKSQDVFPEMHFTQIGSSPVNLGKSAALAPSESTSLATEVMATGVTFDILPGTYASPTYHDPADNEVGNHSRYVGPFAKASVNDWNDLFLVGTPGTSVDVTLRNALDAIKATFSGTTEETGGLYVNLSDSAGNAVDLQPGDEVEVTLGDGSSHQIDVVNIDYIIDRDAETVYGTGPANATLRLLYSVYAAQETTTDASGSFSHDMNQTLSGGYSFDVQYRPSENQVMTFYQNVPQFTIYPLNDYIYGYGPLQESVVATLKDSSGTIKETKNTTTGTNGYYYVSFSADVATGDTVVVDVGPLHYEQEVVALTVMGDTENNVVYGTAPGDAWLNVFDRKYFGPYEHYNYKYFNADQDGNYSAVFDGVSEGDQLEVLYWGGGGHDDRVSTSRYIPAIYIDQTSDAISGYTTPETTGNIIIRDSGGALKATASVSANTTYGSFSYDAECDIVPGDQVQVKIGDLDRTESVVPLSGSLDLNTDTFNGTGPSSEDVGYEVYHWSGSWYRYYTTNGSMEGFASTEATGDFNIDVSALADLVSGDYVRLYYLNENETHYQGAAYTTDPTISISDYPSAVQPNNPVDIEVELDGGAHSQRLYVRWDTESHEDDNLYGHFSGWQKGAIGQNLVQILAPSGGKIYFKAYALVDGQGLWSDEYVIDINETASTTLFDPVSGTTNDNTPTLLGVSAPNTTVTLYQDGTEIMNTSTDDLGYFSFDISSPLSPGTYDFHAVATVNGNSGPDSNTVHLTVDPTLAVDPVHILVTARGQTQHLRDNNGYANLGGQIWTRTGDSVEISIPISHTDVYSADLYVGGVFATSMLNSGDNIYVGSYTPPTSGSYALDLKFRSGGVSGPVHTVNILTGLIDPDGYVYDANQGEDHRIAGATVTCYTLSDTASGTWEVWNASVFGQTNPQTVGADGYYAFYTPPGDYKVLVSAPGYWDYESPVLTVLSEPVHHNVPLREVHQIFLPLTLRH